MSGMTRRKSVIASQTVMLVGLIAIIFVGSALAAYFLFNRPASSVTSTDASSTGPVSPVDGTARQTASPTTPSTSDDFFSKIFESGDTAPDTARPEGWATVLARVTVRLTLAALLTSILAFRPRKFAILFKRNLFVAQTQILLAVVGSALMMIVGDSAARAFGIFAAVSLVRFRTNIRDPKEITVLLVSLAVGLATGVGRAELAMILSLFVLALLWILEYREPELTTRPMELRVKTRNLIDTHDVLTRILKEHNFDSELRALNREDQNEPLGCIVFFVEISPLVSTDELSAEILSADQDNIDSIEWGQQKNAGNVYQ